MFKRFAILFFALFLGGFALAQDDGGSKKKSKEPAERSVSGIVTDENGQPVPGAVVQLKNTKTLEIRSFLAKDKGDYYFHGLSTDIDYELKAEANGKGSGVRTLSSFNTNPDAVVNLQLKK